MGVCASGWSLVTFRYVMPLYGQYWNMIVRIVWSVFSLIHVSSLFVRDWGLGLDIRVLSIESR